ncbi:MAG: glycosyltransferase family 1 protein [Candidatus Omnitrophota bacterium]|jgi:glycosyltransferase involved in cell wall biosynthesis|nr:MAG: glycosyltransferase family 1 protein [Candidatus Omnitrophota bacterium]
MNILFLSRDYPPLQIGGVGTYVYEITRLLAKMGNQVYVITGAFDGPLEYIDEGVHVVRVQAAQWRFFDELPIRLQGITERVAYSISVSQKIKQLVRRHKIDIIESCEARAEGFWFYLFHRNPPLVIKLHTPESIVFTLDRVPQSLDFKCIKALEEWWILRARKLIGLSHNIIDLTCRYFKISLRNVPVIENPLDIDFFCPDPSVHPVRYRILFAGRLEFRKGVHVLIRAIPLVLKRIPEATFIFVGSDCGVKDYLLNKTKELGIEHAVTFLDQVPRGQIPGYYHRCEVSVVPSIWENHPYAVLEAMACGKPVIASNIGGIPEIIQDGVNGVLVPAGSPVSLASAIEKVLLDAGLKEKLGRNARHYIVRQYDPQYVTLKNLAIYEETLSRRKPYSQR